MTFTPYTLITMILSSAIIIVVLNAYLRQINYETLFSPTAVAVVLLTPLVRMFIPIEFPFTKVIRSYAVLPVVSKVMTRPIVQLAPDFDINLTHVLLLTWLVGFVRTEGRSIREYRKFISYSYIMESNEDERDRRIIAEYFSDRNLKPRKIRLLRIPGIHMPVFFGVRDPTILMPVLELTDRQLRDILAHELSHYVHGDAVAKKVLCTLCSVYWWLPPVKKLREWIDDIMEIRADRDVMKGRSHEERDAYIDMMLYVTDSRDSISAAASLYYGTATLSSGGKDITERRFNAIRSPQNPRRQILLTALFVAVLAVVMAFSFCFVVQPATTGAVLHNDEDDKTYAIPESGNYLVQREDGKYDMYMNNEYFAFVESVEDEDLLKNFPIINQQEESP